MKKVMLRTLIRNTRQLTVWQVLNDRYCHKKKGWIKTNLREDAKTEVIDMAVSVLGGRKSWKIRQALEAGEYHWGLDRMYLVKYGKDISCTYGAGQDYPSEIQTIRTYLINS